MCPGILYFVYFVDTSRKPEIAFKFVYVCLSDNTKAVLFIRIRTGLSAYDVSFHTALDIPTYSMHSVRWPSSTRESEIISILAISSLPMRLNNIGFYGIAFRVDALE